MGELSSSARSGRGQRLHRWDIRRLAPFLDAGGRGPKVEAHTGITVRIYDDKIETTEYDALGHIPLFIQVFADVSLPITSNIMNESRVR